MSPKNTNVFKLKIHRKGGFYRGWDKVWCYRREPTKAHERTLNVRDVPPSGFLTAI